MTAPQIAHASTNLSKRFHLNVNRSSRTIIRKNPTRTSIRNGVKSRSKIITRWLAGTKQAAKINGSRKYFLRTINNRVARNTVINIVV
jgi:hypothetical protein